MTQKTNTLAVFDFDGTITKCDSLIPFLWTVAGTPRFLLNLGLLVLWVITFKLGFLTRQEAKEKVLALFLKGMERKKLEELGSSYAQNRLAQLIRKKALLALHDHLQAGDRVMIISASPDFYIRSWAQTVGNIEVHSTRLEFDSVGHFTGHILGKNCYGPEKVARLTAVVPDLDRYTLVVYGDSKGDHDLYKIAQQAHHRYFENDSR